MTDLMSNRAGRKVERQYSGGAPGFRPLYRQVYDYLVRQVAEGVWRPGQILPSEQALADSLKVSQGTVRKALDAMTSEQLVERHQGKGTFVAAHTPERAMFRFFRLSRPNGARISPTSDGESLKKRGATARERQLLKLGADEQVYDIRRVRSDSGAPIVYETVILSATVFAGIERRTPLPNALYELYQREYGRNIVSVDENLRADLATKEDAKRLGVEPGAPLLQVERVAIGVDGAPVELRISRCNTADAVYSLTLT